MTAQRSHGGDGRSRVLAAQRHREQVARAIVRAAVRFSPRLPSERDARAKAVANVLDGLGFNVHLAREYGERLVTEGLVFGDRAEAHGQHDEAHRLRGRARTGRRLLAALEGQPSECQRCGGHGSLNRLRFGRPDACPDCHGTGHNLHGVLPPVEWSPAVYRKVVDAVRHYRGTPSWCNAEPFARMANLRVLTRVVPRGEHRDESRIGERGWAPPSTVSDRWYSGDEMVEPRGSLVPRWRRGEIKHAEQRRERARR